MQNWIQAQHLKSKVRLQSHSEISCVKLNTPLLLYISISDGANCFLPFYPGYISRALAVAVIHLGLILNFHPQLLKSNMAKFVCSNNYCNNNMKYSVKYYLSICWYWGWYVWLYLWTVEVLLATQSSSSSVGLFGDTVVGATCAAELQLNSRFRVKRCHDGPTITTKHRGD